MTPILLYDQNVNAFVAFDLFFTADMPMNAVSFLHFHSFALRKQDSIRAANEIKEKKVKQKERINHISFSSAPPIRNSQLHASLRFRFFADAEHKTADEATDMESSHYFSNFPESMRADARQSGVFK